MKNIFKATFLSLALVSLLASCEAWEEYNTNPYGITDEMLGADYANIGAYYPQIMQAVYYNRNNSNWEFQLIQNLTADTWSGYMSNVSAFLSNANTGNLYMVEGWVSEEWNYTYKRVMSPIFNSIKPQADNDENRHFYAPALIMQVYAMDRVVDMYGPVAYSLYGQSATGGNYETVEATYNAFFKDLDTAVDALDNFIEATGSEVSSTFKKYDSWAGGDFSRWIRFANTLRMRLAIHLTKVAPTKAQAEIQKAVANKYGLLNGTKDVIQQSSSTWNHPLYTLSQGWTDAYMGAVIESLMTGYSDPREGKYFLETTNATAKGEGLKFASLRMGNDAPGKTAYAGYSMCAVAKTAPGVIMVPAEAQFILAEACLRGWVSGNAKDYYEAGVKASFEQYGLTGADEYLASDAVPADYVNPLNHSWDIDATNFQSPKWNDADDNETKLEKIIDQKYLAIYPDGFEAWTELRRTGYPHAYPVIVNASQGILKNDEIVRRSTYPSDLPGSDPTGYAQACGFLGGPDTQATRIWWDADKGNFE